MTFSVEQVRADFPVLNREVNGQPLVYLDSAASAQKPEAVIGRRSGILSPRLRGGAPRHPYPQRGSHRADGSRASAGGHLP